MINVRTGDRVLERCLHGIRRMTGSVYCFDRWRLRLRVTDVRLASVEVREDDGVGLETVHTACFPYALDLVGFLSFCRVQVRCRRKFGDRAVGLGRPTLNSSFRSKTYIARVLRRVHTMMRRSFLRRALSGLGAIYPILLWLWRWNKWCWFTQDLMRALRAALSP